MGLSNGLWLGLPVAKGMILRPFGNGEMLNMANVFNQQNKGFYVINTFLLRRSQA